MTADPVALSKGLRRLRKIVDSRFFKRWGSSDRKKAIWDREFGCGDWQYLDNTRNDPIYGYLARHCAGLEELVRTYAAVINELATENEALRDQLGKPSASVRPLPRRLGPSPAVPDWAG